MKKYEYKLLFRGSLPSYGGDRKKYISQIHVVQDEFNRLGEEGWEFVCWLDNVIFFKREINKI